MSMRPCLQRKSCGSWTLETVTNMREQRIVSQRSPRLLDQQPDDYGSELDATVDHRALQQLFAHQCAFVT